ncbi:MAG: 50S ribosomal protein L4 [Acidobacteria bacterium]|nr:50S ribosomal protein L4 [Acidobacteriota bacterium]
MAEIEVKNLANEVVGKLDLSDEVFGAALNRPLIWEAVRHYRASRRAGTAATKTRAMVSGSGKKLWRQKGTGRARIGSIRSPLWRHGGTVHGPQPRDYGYRFPRKKLRSALRSALSAKLEENRLTVVEDFRLETHKTQQLKKILEGFGATRKVLLVEASENRNLLLSARNLPAVKLVPNTGLNIFDVVNSNRLVFSRDAILRVQEVLAP